jgi:hypothetical protein
MATTTNYSWTTPDDTDLVKDGAAAIRTLGSSIDTTTKNLNPETTLGDISYRSSTANTNTRLPLGTAGQVLKVNSGATAPEWGSAPSGGANWSLLNSGGTALTGAQTITVSSVPTGTDKIMILVEGASSASASSFITIRLNTDTGSNYATLFARWLPTSSYSVNNQTAAGGIGSLGTSITLGRLSTSASGTLNGAITITGCNASGVKAFQSVGAGTPGGASEQETWIGQGYYNSASVISSISVFSTTGNLDAGTVYVYTSA